MEARARNYDAPRRGGTNSNDFNSFQDLAVGDIRRIVDEVNSNKTGIQNALQVLIAETRSNTEEINRLKAHLNFEALYAAKAGIEYTFLNTWRRTSVITWDPNEDGTPLWAESRRARIATPYGQGMVPYQNLKDLLTYRSLDTGSIVTRTDATVEVTAVDEDNALKVLTGTPTNALNGINESYWVREVLYNTFDDKEEVKCQIDITVPTGAVNQSNQLCIHPYPNGLCDIVQILYSTDGSDPSYVLGTDNITYPEDVTFPIKDATYIRLAFSPLAITKLRIILRQRNFAERNGYKSFQYGLQEVALRFVEYDSTASVNPAPGSGIGVCVKIDAPDGYIFRNMTGFWSTPAFKTATAGWPLYYRVYTDSGISNLVWSSYTDSLPQSAAVDLRSASTSSLFVIVQFAYNSTLSVPTILQQFALRYSTEASS